MKKRVLATMMAMAMATTMFAGCGSASTASAPEETKEEATEEETAEEADSEDAGDVTYSKHTIAAMIPLTGNNMQYGISYENALKMAVDDFNAQGGLDGEDIILEINDDKSDQKEAINLANKIIEEDDTFCVIGSFGSAVSMAVAPIFQDAKLPMISPNTSHPDYPGMGDMMIPISPIADVERTKVTELMYDAVDGKRLAIMHQNTDLGVTGAEIIEKYYTELGGEVVMVENFVPQQTKDFTPILSKIKAENPDLIYIDGEYNDLGNICIQMDNIGGFEDIQVFGPGNAFKQEFLDIAGDTADGIILAGTTPVYLDSIMAVADYSDYLVDFTNRYNELYPDVPCDGFAAAAYDAAMFAMNGAKNAGTDDPYKFIEAVLAVPCDTACGQGVTYDGNNVSKDVYVYTVENGEFAPYKG